jgi:thiol:disulfide interchange protein DsbA
MDCKEISEILDEHRLASLSSAERAHFDEHLADCESCSEAVSVAHRLAAETSPSPSVDLLVRLRASIGDSDALARRHVPRQRWQTAAGLAAAAAVVLAIGFGLRGQAPEPVSADTAALSAAADTSVSSDPVALRYTEGQHFSRIPGTSRLSSVGDRISAWVFFMWSCRHCYEFEGILKGWARRQSGSDVDVIRVPVQWNALGALHARAFYAAESLGVGDSISEAFFEEIHQNGRLLDTVTEIEAVFADAGIDRAAFASAFESDEVGNRLATVRKIASTFQVDSVPAIVVDGIYKTTPSTAGSFEDMVQVADEIVAIQERVAFQGDSEASEETDVPDEDCVSDSLDVINDDIDSAEQELERLRRTYTDQHPNVMAAMKKVDSLHDRRFEMLAVLRNECAENA